MTAGIEVEPREELILQPTVTVQSAPTLGSPGGLRPDLSVVVPLHNERSTVQELYSRIAAVLEEEQTTFEVLFVDDGSTDGSLDVLRGIARNDPRLRLLRLRRNFGKAAALATGFRAAKGLFVATMDADLQDDPNELPRLLTAARGGFDVVSGWKRHRRDPLSRRLASRVFNAVTRRASALPLHDFNCGLKIYSRGCAREIAEYCYGELHRFLPMLAYWRGYRVTEAPVSHVPRAHGRSRYGLERYVRGALDLLTAIFLSRYARRPMHIFGGVGLALLSAGGIGLAYLLGLKVFWGSTIGGRPLLVLAVLACIAGLQLILTGLIAEILVGRRASYVPFTTLNAGDEEYAAPVMTLVADPGRPACEAAVYPELAVEPRG